MSFHEHARHFQHLVGDLGLCKGEIVYFFTLLTVSPPVPGGSAPNPVNDVLASTEDVQNSIPNSPGSANQSQGPLSPKTPTAMRSTSQVCGEVEVPAV